MRFLEEFICKLTFGFDYFAQLPFCWQIIIITSALSNLEKQTCRDDLDDSVSDMHNN